MNVISSNVDMNEYKLLGTKSKQIVNALSILRMPLFLGFLKPKKENKLKSDDIGNELIKYIKSNISKIRYMTIQNHKNSLKPLKELKKLKLFREQEIDKIKNTTNRKLNVLNDKLESLKRFNAHEDEIDEIERLKEKVKYSNDHETKISKLLTDFKYEKEDILHEILLNEIKLKKFGISETTINAIKKSFIV